MSTHRLMTDATCITLLRDAAREAQAAGRAAPRPLRTRDGALRDLLAEASRHLAAVDIQLRVEGASALSLHARSGDRGVHLELREATDGVNIPAGIDGVAASLRWNHRTLQWEGRRMGKDPVAEPAWYTVAKKVASDLACPAA